MPEAAYLPQQLIGEILLLLSTTGYAKGLRILLLQGPKKFSEGFWLR